MATTAALVEHLAKFPEGLTFTELQRFIVESNGLDYDEKDGEGRRKYRGYWCSTLGTSGKQYNGRTYVPKHSFLLANCTKVGKRYVLRSK